MGGQPNSHPITIAKALDIAKETQNTQLPPNVSAVLEKKVQETWQKIQAQPSTYVMTREEYSVFSIYRSRYNNHVAEQAVARFWSNYKGEDGASSNAATSNPYSSGRT